MFSKILVANRGEIARRILRSAKKLGVKTVAVYSEADAEAPFVHDADQAVCIGPPPPKESYLRADAIVQAARSTGAEAIHPGYGFLSESDALVTACEREGIAFVGPPLCAIEAMGSKTAAKQAMRIAGVPVVPGSDGALIDVDDAVHSAKAIGYPVMLKTAMGGGGIGMRMCKKEKQLRGAFEDAQKKGEMFFGSAELLLEKYIASPHHVEVQILADSQGTIVHLFDRECSVQRRHQKILEEAPSPFISADTRARLCQAAVKAAAAVGYQNAGTVEFIVDGEQNFYFLEMNTRLQVEHPITEEILGVDIVAEQLRIAAGEPLSFRQEDLSPAGHAIELRVCAEDPQKRFFPSPGTIEHAKWPQGEGIRVEAGIESHGVVPPFYDSLLAKIIGHGRDRSEAIARLEAALKDTEIRGVTTNLGLHAEILAHPVFRGGVYNTDFLKDVMGLKS